MPSQYRTISGVKYERDLLEEADTSTQGGFAITEECASRLWDMAMDGNRVTATERKTIEYIMSKYALDHAAKKLLQEKLGAPPVVRRKSTSYYKSINGINYDRKLLEEGETRAAANGGKLLLWDLVSLWAKAHDGRGVTPCERRTIELLAKDYPLEDDARKWVKHELGLDVPPKALLNTPLIVAPVRAAPGMALLDQSAPPTVVSHLRSASDPLVDVDSASALPRKAILHQKTSPIVAQARPPAVAPRVNSATSSEPGRASVNSLALALVTPTEKGSGGFFNSMVQGFVSLWRRGQNGEPAQKRSRLEAPGGVKTPTRRLNADLEELLRSGSDCPPLALEWQQLEATHEIPEDAELIAKRADAAAEITRILGSRATEVLGGGSKEEQSREFKRIALLLHPDKAIVNHDDEDANLAMRLALAALKRSRA